MNLRCRLYASDLIFAYCAPYPIQDTQHHYRDLRCRIDVEWKTFRLKQKFQYERYNFNDEIVDNTSYSLGIEAICDRS